MKVGDLVRYRRWLGFKGPLGLVVKEMHADSSFHHRIKVMWLGEKIPVQASALSTSGAKITAWVLPKHFHVIDKNHETGNETI